MLSILGSVVRETINEKVTFELRSGGDEGMIPEDQCREEHSRPRLARLCSRNTPAMFEEQQGSKCKGSRVKEGRKN